MCDTSEGLLEFQYELWRRECIREKNVMEDEYRNHLFTPLNNTYTHTRIEAKWVIEAKDYLKLRTSCGDENA